MGGSPSQLSVVRNLKSTRYASLTGNVSWLDRWRTGESDESERKLWWTGEAWTGWRGVDRVVQSRKQLLGVYGSD